MLKASSSAWSWVRLAPAGRAIAAVISVGLWSAIAAAPPNDWVDSVIDHLDLPISSCRGEIAPEWRANPITCVRFEGDLCDFNERLHDHIERAGLWSSYSSIRSERLFPEQNDQLLDVAEIGYLVAGHPVLFIAYASDNTVLIAHSRSSVGDDPAPDTLRSAFPSRHPVSGVDLVEGMSLGGHHFTSTPTLLFQVSVERPQTPEGLLGVTPIMLTATVERDGGVTGATPLQPDDNPELAKLAVEAVEQWRYRPAQACGLPAAHFVLFSIDLEVPSSSQTK